jgi:hypothetical protein
MRFTTAARCISPRVQPHRTSTSGTEPGTLVLFRSRQPIVPPGSTRVTDRPRTVPRSEGTHQSSERLPSHYHAEGRLYSTACNNITIASSAASRNAILS